MRSFPSPSAEVIGRLVTERFDKLHQALKALELPNGPKLEDRHYLLVGLTDGMMFEKKAQASAARKDIQAATKKLKEVSSLLHALPKLVRERMEERSEVTIPTHYLDGEPRMLVPRVEHHSLQSILTALRDELERELQRVEAEREAYWTGSGTSPDLKARLIALKIAQIFNYLRPGEPLTIGTNDEKPSTPFTRTVHAVFAIEGIGVSFRSPCAYAIRKLGRGATWVARGAEHE